ncbi:hypothetical protein EON63_16375 [archaeon]|nr:MAG: hypothetical protein EON63_16375 [archaeon]
MMNPRQSREFFEALTNSGDGDASMDMGGVGAVQQGEEDAAKVYRVLRQSLPTFFSIENETAKDADAPPV